MQRCYTSSFSLLHRLQHNLNSFGEVSTGSLQRPRGAILDSSFYILNSGSILIFIVRGVASKGAKLPIITVSPLQALYMVVKVNNL